MKAFTPFLIAFIVALALAVALAPAAAGGETSRDDALEGIEALAGIKKPSDAQQEMLRDLCVDFLKRFPRDEEAPSVRQRLGVTLAKLGDDEAAGRELAAITASAKPGSEFRQFTLKLLGEVRMGLGDVARAREALQALVAESPNGKYSKGASADLRDLDRIGKPAKDSILKNAGVPAKLPCVVAFVRRGSPAVQGLPAGATIIEIAGWDDPKIADAHLPAVPRVYVIGKRGQIAAVGVRGRAIEAALRRAEAESWP
jgi:hypothetical protein